MQMQATLALKPPDLEAAQSIGCSEPKMQHPRSEIHQLQMEHHALLKLFTYFGIRKTFSLFRVQCLAAQAKASDDGSNLTKVGLAGHPNPSRERGTQPPMPNYALCSHVAPGSAGLDSNVICW